MMCYKKYTMRNVPASRRGESGDDATSTVSSYSDPPVDKEVPPAWVKEWQDRLVALEGRSNDNERKMESLNEEVKCVDRKIDGVNNSILGLNADVSGQFAELKGLLLSSRSFPQQQDGYSSSGFSAESHRMSSSDPRFSYPQSSSAANPAANMIPPEYAPPPQYPSPHQYYFNFGASPPTPR